MDTEKFSSNSPERPLSWQNIKSQFERRTEKEALFESLEQFLSSPTEQALSRLETEISIFFSKAELATFEHQFKPTEIKESNTKTSLIEKDVSFNLLLVKELANRIIDKQKELNNIKNLEQLAQQKPEIIADLNKILQAIDLIKKHRQFRQSTEALESFGDSSSLSNLQARETLQGPLRQVGEFAIEVESSPYALHFKDFLEKAAEIRISLE